MHQTNMFDYIHDIERLSCHQIHRLIDKGEMVEELKAEWYRRWKLEYPYIKTMSGVKKDR